MKVRQIEIGRVTPDSVNQQKISGFVSDGGASALGGALQNVSKQFQQAQVEVDQTHAEEARLNFDRDITTILHDADNGYFNTSGKTAYEKQEETRKAIEIARKNHAKNLSPEQTKMFDNVANRMIESNNKAITTHGSRGRKTWDIATQEAVVENSVEKASLNFENDEEIAVQLATLRNSVKSSSDQQGIGPEATNERLQTMTSKFYSSIIGKAIEGNTGRAKDLFKRVSKYLEPDDKSKVERVLKATINKESAMSNADMWIEKGYDVSRGMTEAAKIKDPDLREATENRFRHLKSVHSQAEKTKQYDTAESVIKRMQDGLVKSDIPVQEWDAMSSQQRTAVNNFEKNRISALEKKDKLYEIKEAGLYEDQIELYHQAIRDGQIDLKDIPEGDRAEIKQSDYNALLKTQEDTTYPDGKPKSGKPSDNMASLVEVDNLAAAGNFSDAKRYLLDNVDKFKPATFGKYLTRINKGINDPKEAHEIKSIFTDRQAIKRMFPDDEKRADVFLGEYDDWYTGFQSQHGRVPTIDERKSAQSQLMLDFKEKGMIWGENFKDEEDFAGSGKRTQTSLLVKSIQAINQRRAQNGLSPLSENQIRAYEKKKYEVEQKDNKAKFMKLTDHVKKTEKFTAKAFWDHKQFTNGYGTKAKHKNEVITKAEAQKRFDKHLKKDLKRVEAFVPGDTPQGIKNALASLSYNSGYKWMNAGLGKAIKAKDWKKAKSIFKKYNKAEVDGKLVEQAGLVKRRAIEAEWFNG